MCMHGFRGQHLCNIGEPYKSELNQGEFFLMSMTAATILFMM